MILVSNDDGIHSEGSRALQDAMALPGDLVVVVPDSKRSAVTHSLTLDLLSVEARHASWERLSPMERE